jgi:arsenite oxidase small subunit
MEDKNHGCSGCAKRAEAAPKWRRDFPIEWEGDHYVTRREMVKFLTLGSLLIALGNWITAGVARFRGRATKAREARLIGTIMDLDRGGGSLLFRFPTEHDPCIAVRSHDGNIRAYSQVCTHLSCAVIYDRQQDALLCPCHRGVFNIEGKPVAGPPTRQLPRIIVELRGDQLFATEVRI